MSELLGHVRNVVVVVDNVGLVPVLCRPVLTIHTVHLLLLLLLVGILLYLGHRVDPPMVEWFEVSPAGERGRVEMQVSLLSLTDPGRESVVRVRGCPRLGVSRVSLVWGLGLGQVSWQSVEVIDKLPGMLVVWLTRLARLSQVPGAGS